jgi:UDP-N-acetylglucosamine:LPS N-acetylglucosamine transferase
MNATLPFPIYTPEALNEVPKNLECRETFIKETTATKPLRILILSSLTGWGHKKVADALQVAFEQAIENTQGPIQVHVEEVLESSNLFNRTLSSIYNLFLRYAQSWMFLYYHAINALNLSCQPLVLEPMMPYAERLIRRHRPDIIISVHPMMQYFGGMLQRANLKMRGASLPFYTLVTDPCYGFWKGWVHSNVSHYFTATVDATQQLKDYGVSSHQITEIGLPNMAEQKHFTELEKQTLRQSVLGEASTHINLLFNAGWAGGGGIEFLFKAFLHQASPETLQRVNLFFQAGSNHALRERIQTVAKHFPHVSIHVCSLEQEMASLYALADAIITKPGASTVFEALHHGVPVLIDAQKRLMPQEVGTAQWIEKIGVGVSLPHVETLRHLVDEWLKTPQTLIKLKAKAPHWHLTDASSRVVHRILETSLSP